MKKFAVLKNSVVKALELPREVVMDLPLISMTGSDEMMIENYKSILTYSATCVRVHTSVGVIAITGKNLLLRYLMTENLLISGQIAQISFSSA